jgi:hypothetical protein
MTMIAAAAADNNIGVVDIGQQSILIILSRIYQELKVLFHILNNTKCCPPLLSDTDKATVGIRRRRGCIE